VTRIFVRELVDGVGAAQVPAVLTRRAGCVGYLRTGPSATTLRLVASACRPQCWSLRFTDMLRARGNLRDDR
jgi:hypothetical protein